ncbi:MAG: hypothetical protein V1859_11740 [archaeon]
MPKASSLKLPSYPQIIAKISYGIFFLGSILLWNFLGNFEFFSEWYHQIWQWGLIAVSGFLLFRK